METLLIRVLVWLIVAAVLVAIVRLIPENWVDAWLKQVAMIIIVGILLIALLVYIILPMIHMAGAIG